MGLIGTLILSLVIHSPFSVPYLGSLLFFLHKLQVSASQEAVGPQGWHYLILICPLVNVSKDFGAVLI